MHAFSFLSFIDKHYYENFQLRALSFMFISWILNLHDFIVYLIQK
jgi:hypothetical protein